MSETHAHVIYLGDYIAGEQASVSVRETVGAVSVTLVKARFVGLDPDRSTVVTATSGGVARIKAAKSGTTSKWNYCPVEVSHATRVWATEVVAYTTGAVTGLWTIRPIGANVVVGDSIKFPAYPVMAYCTGTTSGGKGTVTIRPSGANEYTAYTGERRLLCIYSTATDIRRCIGVHEVVATL